MLPRVTEASARQDYLNVKAAYDRANATIAELKAQITALTGERDKARQHAEALAYERDCARDAWRKAQDQIAREQEMTRQAFRTARAHNRSAQQYNSVIRSCMTPEQWFEAMERAKVAYPHIWNKED